MGRIDRRTLPALSSAARDALRPGALPGPTSLMQPVPMGRQDPGSGWLFEPRFDGARCLAVYDGRELRLLENGLERCEHRYTGLAEALTLAGTDRFALDGVVLEVDPSFEQGLVLREDERTPADVRPREREHRFLAFDLLHAAGYDLTPIPLLERRGVLRALFEFSTSVMYVRESSAPAKVVMHQAERERWPGVVAKRAESPYVFGRSPEWRVWRRPG